MSEIFNKKLFFLTTIALGLCTSGFAQELTNESLINQFANNKTEKHVSTFAPSTKEEIIQAFDLGLALGATHMLIVWDTWNIDDSYDFIVYSYPGEAVNDYIAQYNTPGFYRVSSVFAMHLDIHKQLSDHRWHPEYPENSENP